MSEGLTLVYNNPDPSAGGIPRYAHRILEGLNEKEIEKKDIDFSEVYGESIPEKLYNVLFGRKKYIKRKRKDLSDVNHFLQPEIYYPVSEGTDIVTVHDLAVIEGLKDIHSFYEAGRKFLLGRRFKKTLSDADKFIAVSEQTKKEMLEYDVDEEDITVIPHGVREKFGYNQDFSDRDNTIGYLGSLNPRKRVGRLLGEWEQAREQENMQDFNLKIGGWGGSKSQELKDKYHGEKDVEFLGRVPEEDIVEYYNSMKALFFPTEYEGFGLPILEALACGTPVFVYQDAEITPEVKELCYKVESVEQAEEIIADIDEEEMKEKSEKIKEEFSWDKTLQKTIEVYENVE